MEDELAESEAAFGQLQNDLAQVEGDLVEQSDARAANEAELATAKADLAEAESGLASALAEAEAARAEADVLRLQYDPQIRDALQAEIDAGVAADCASSVEAYDQQVTYRYDPSWAPVVAESDYKAAVDACAAPGRNKSAEEREAERLATFTVVNVDEIIKNPYAAEGEHILMYARIVQYDVNTGTCSFHANFAAEYSSRSYDYDERAQFGYGSSELAQAIQFICPDLDGIDVDDFVKVWATGAGAYSYDTSIGGRNTVPLFDIDKIELIKKA